jgi:hypothetical protein
VKAQKYVALLFLLAFVHFCVVAVAQDRPTTSAFPNAIVLNPPDQPAMLAFTHVTII